jgi:hypothetical protein
MLPSAPSAPIPRRSRIRHRCDGGAEGVSGEPVISSGSTRGYRWRDAIGPAETCTDVA